MHYSLFQGANLAKDFGNDATEALEYMAANAGDLFGDDFALMVFDDAGMCQIALIDAREPDDG